MKKPALRAPQREQVIRDNETYTLDEFRARVGWGEHAMRSARRAGLRVRRAGGRAFVAGADFIDWLASLDGP